MRCRQVNAGLASGGDAGSPWRASPGAAPASLHTWSTTSQPSRTRCPSLSTTRKRLSSAARRISRLPLVSASPAAACCASRSSTCRCCALAASVSPCSCSTVRSACSRRVSYTAAACVRRAGGASASRTTHQTPVSSASHAPPGSCAASRLILHCATRSTWASGTPVERSCAARSPRAAANAMNAVSSIQTLRSNTPSSVRVSAAGASAAGASRCSVGSRSSSAGAPGGTGSDGGGSAASGSAPAAPAAPPCGAIRAIARQMHASSMGQRISSTPARYVVTWASARSAALCRAGGTPAPGSPSAMPASVPRKASRSSAAPAAPADSARLASASSAWSYRYSLVCAVRKRASPSFSGVAHARSMPTALRTVGASGSSSSSARGACGEPRRATVATYLRSTACASDWASSTCAQSASSARYSGGSAAPAGASALSSWSISGTPGALAAVSGSARPLRKPSAALRTPATAALATPAAAP